MEDQWFRLCKTLEEGRKIYREALMKEHPDRGGNEETFKRIQESFEQFLKSRPDNDFVKDMHHRQGTDARSKMQFTPEFYEALAKIMAMNVDVEVIGTWIHVTNYAGRDVLQLTFMGCWYSVGHKAMIWSGDEKKRVAPRYTTDELRSRYGAEEKRRKRFV